MSNIIKLNNFNININCGICGKPIKPTMLNEPRSITIQDKETDSKRDHSFNCCGKTWLLKQFEDGYHSIDHGKEIY